MSKRSQADLFTAFQAFLASQNPVAAPLAATAAPAWMTASVPNKAPRAPKDPSAPKVRTFISEPDGVSKYGNPYRCFRLHLNGKATNMVYRLPHELVLAIASGQIK